MNLLDKIGSRVIFAGFMLAKNLLTPVAFGVMGLALDSRGRVLLVRQSYMKGWRLPGGGANRGEPAAEAIMRELREEVGLTSCAAPELLGLYTRRAGWVTNVVALYRLTDIELAFRPNWEVREIIFADPAAPPPDTAPGTLRRLAEFTGREPPAAFW
jgi:ADP-ribose pyrophosphatase YjhB (NUDIX family)